MKSNWTSKIRGPYGIGEVVRPREFTYRGTFHQWLSKGVSASLTLPTICIHMCRVALVSSQLASGRAGQQSGESETAVVLGCGIAASPVLQYSRGKRRTSCRAPKT